MESKTRYPRNGAVPYNERDMINKAEWKQMAKNTIHASVKRDWYLFLEERELLDKWYVLKWTGQFFAGAAIQRVAYRYIEHDGSIYQVHYKRGYYELCAAAPQVMISFRRIKGAALGIALVRPVFRSKGRA